MSTLPKSSHSVFSWMTGPAPRSGSREKVVVVDLRSEKRDVPGISALREHFLNVPLALTVGAQEEWEVIEEARQAGIDGVLIEPFASEELDAVVRLVARGLRCLPEPTLCQLKQMEAKVALTERESEILRAVSEGLEDKTVAARLNISLKTVQCHLQRIFKNPSP